MSGVLLSDEVRRGSHNDLGRRQVVAKATHEQLYHTIERSGGSDRPVSPSITLLKLLLCDSALLPVLIRFDPKTVLACCTRLYILTFFSKTLCLNADIDCIWVCTISSTSTSGTTMRSFNFTLTILLISNLILSLPPSRGSDFDGQLDHDVNPEIAEQIHDINEAQFAVESLERYASVPPDYFSPLVGYTEEGAERARSHLASSASRFMLRSDSKSPGGAIAYSTFVFHHPRTCRRVFAVTMLRLRRNREGEFLGEAHFPEGQLLSERRGLWHRLNRHATFDRRDLMMHFGRYALHLP